MADDLHARYMDATETWRTHRKGCQPCQNHRPCETGAPLVERFAQLQSAYLNRLRTR